MRLLLDGAAGPSRECASTCLLVEAVCLEFKLTQVSILSFNGEMQQMLASCNIWEKLNRHPCIQQSCAFGPRLLCICRLVRQYRARAPSASLYHAIASTACAGLREKEQIAARDHREIELTAVYLAYGIKLVCVPQAPLDPCCRRAMPQASVHSAHRLGHLAYVEVACHES